MHLSLHLNKQNNNNNNKKSNNLTRRNLKLIIQSIDNIVYSINISHMSNLCTVKKNKLIKIKIFGYKNMQKKKALCLTALEGGKEEVSFWRL